MLFVDYKQGYDIVNQESLWRVMEKLGVSSKFIRMITAYYMCSKL